MASKRTTKRGTVLTALPKGVRRVQAEAEKALHEGYKATLGMLPPGPRKAVRDLGSQLDEAASELRARGRKALRGVERRREAVVDRVEAVVARAEKRGGRAVRTIERESEKWLEAFGTGARRMVRAVAGRLDVASAHDVALLNKRVALLERKLTSRTRAA
ncbi:hypothetical protein KF840_16180 [bacterium]|nr:hypothetical protein [bacterium]